MNKFVFAGVIFTVFLVLRATALPTALDEVPENHEDLVRQKRVTCDLLSFSAGGFEANHSICALHCVKLGKKGGYCDKGTCYCRQ